jgi:peptidoglycan/LPS O-acetylase OafA/YrhL
VASLFVMIGHYLGIYKYAQAFTPPEIYWLDDITNSRFSFVISEGWWLYLFFVVSGYLVAKSRIRTVQDIIIKIISRFLRLAFPILFSYLIIYILYICVGFHTTETSALFQCTWFQSYYLGNYSIMDVLKGAYNVLILNDSELNPPYWCLKDMMRSSILIYVLRYLYEKLSKYQDIAFSVLVIITFYSVRVSSVITACLIGMLVSLYEERNIKVSYFAFWAMVIILALNDLPDLIVSSLFFASIIVFVPRINWIESILSSKPVVCLGKINWGIYSFHWPIICSIGALSIIKLNTVYGMINAYALTFWVVLLLTIISAVAFYYSFEKLASFLVGKITFIITELCSLYSTFVRFN